MVPASQTLNTQMAQIASAAPETEETEVVPGKVKVTLNKTTSGGREGTKKERTNYEIPMSMSDGGESCRRAFLSVSPTAAAPSEF